MFLLPGSLPYQRGGASGGDTLLVRVRVRVKVRVRVRVRVRMSPNPNLISP